MVFGALAAIGRLLLDVCVAFILLGTLLACLPLLTLASSVLQRLMDMRSSRDFDPSSPGGRRRTSAESSNNNLGGTLALFSIKSTLLFLALLQTAALLGGPAAAWACALALEARHRSRDSSVRLLVEPALGPLDYVFLLFVAPFLAAPAGGVHGMTAGWFTYACACFFWRSDASAYTALSLWLLAYLLAWSLGFFAWRRLVATLGLVPADDGVLDVLLLLGGTGALLLVPPATRGPLMGAILVFSPTFRGGLGVAWLRGTDILLRALYAGAAVSPGAAALPRGVGEAAGGAAASAAAQRWSGSRAL